MAKTITREQYSDYATEWICSTGEQWLENGIPITFVLECDDDYYYLSVEVQNNAYDFYDENPEYDRSELNKAEKFCKEFGCKICENLDEVNKFVREELPSYCEFEKDDDGSIYGN